MTNEELLENLMNGTLDESGHEILQARRLESVEFDADVSEFERVLELLKEDDAGELASPALLASTKSKVVTAIATGVAGGALVSSGTSTFLTKTGLLIVGGIGAVATGVYVFFGGDDATVEKSTDKLNQNTVIEQQVEPEMVEMPSIGQSSQVAEPASVGVNAEVRSSEVEETPLQTPASEPQADIIGDATDPLLKARYAAEQQRLSNYMAIGEAEKTLQTYGVLVDLAAKLGKDVESELWKQRKAEFEQNQSSVPPNN